MIVGRKKGSLGLTDLYDHWAYLSVPLWLAPLPNQLLASTNVFSLHGVVPFPTCHESGLIRYVDVWSDFSQVTSGTWVSLPLAVCSCLSLLTIPLCRWTTVYLCIHQPKGMWIVFSVLWTFYKKAFCKCVWSILSIFTVLREGGFLVFNGLGLGFQITLEIQDSPVQWKRCLGCIGHSWKWHAFVFGNRLFLLGFNMQ